MGRNPLYSLRKENEMTIKNPDCIGLDKKVEAERAKLCTLHFDGVWVLRTTETGIEVNGKVAWYVIAVAYTK